MCYHLSSALTHKRHLLPNCYIRTLCFNNLGLTIHCINSFVDIFLGIIFNFVQVYASVEKESKIDLFCPDTWMLAWLGLEFKIKNYFFSHWTLKKTYWIPEFSIAYKVFSFLFFFLGLFFLSLEFWIFTSMCLDIGLFHPTCLVLFFPFSTKTSMSAEHTEWVSPWANFPLSYPSWVFWVTASHTSLSSQPLRNH